MKTEEEINAVMNEAQDATYKTDQIPGSYAQGVVAALEWVLDPTAASPLEEED